MTNLQIPIRLKKISGGANVRTNEVIGVTQSTPEVGKPFRMLAKAIDESASFRVVITSPVKSISSNQNGFYQFTTITGSEYSVEVLYD